MTDSGSASTSSDTPAEALGPAWDLLDALPRASTPSSMTSTTVEMVAAAARRPSQPAWRRGWVGPAAIVAATFIAGMVAGRATMTDPDDVVFDYLPVLEHYDVLKEAGSIEFLAQVARRNYPPPRRFTFGRGGDRPGDRGGDAAPPAYEALDAAVAELATASFGNESGLAAERRAAFATRPADERRRIAEAAAEFQRLSVGDRRDLVRFARALGGRDGEGPDRDELLAAARLWHQWLATRDPADRKGVIDLDTTERLEWLDHYALARPATGRGGPFREGGGFRGFPPPSPPPEGPPPGGPRFNDWPPEGPRRGPPPPEGMPGPPR